MRTYADVCVIQEIHIGGSIHFGAMSCSIGAAAEPLLQQVAYVSIRQHTSAYVSILGSDS